MGNFLKRFIDDQSGATAIEYGLIAALLGISMIAAATNYSDSVNGMFGRVGNVVAEADASAD